MAKYRRKLKKKVSLILTCLILVICCIGSIFYLDYREKEILKEDKAREEKLIKRINNSYSKYVKVLKDAILYEKVDDEYQPAIKVEEEKTFTLKNQKIDKNTKYFCIEELGYYVRYQDVEKIDSLALKDDRYKNYLPFNENIVTKDSFKLYQNEKLVYEIYLKLDTPIIEKDDNGYFIEFNDELYFISNDDVLNTYEKENTNLVQSTSVPVTVYHFIYLDDDTSCNESICHSVSQVRSHFNYLRENNFFTINTTELSKFIDGKIRLPENVILVTIDDGARAENFIPLLEEYKVNATLFLVSSWYPKEKFKSNYMEIASHSNNLHDPGKCPGGQGSALKCLDKEFLLDDLRKSRETLDGTKAFCFPFYEFNDYAISVIEEAGFEMGFIGGGRKATQGINKFKIPRISLNKWTTVEQYAKLIN